MTQEAKQLDELPRQEDASCAPEEGFIVQQLRMENAWLRQRLHALAKLSPRQRVDEQSVSA